MPSTKAQLPRILCFHGAGSSAAIFRIQSRKIEHALRHRFRFVFVDGPIDTVAGPGILPLFEGAGPYYRWHCDVSAASHFDITESEIAAERRLVRLKLDWLLRTEDGGAPFVGVMAFSQGTRVATGLLLDHQQQQQQQQQQQCQKNHLPPLKFAVLLCGTYPPLPLTDAPIPPLPADDEPMMTAMDSSAFAQRYPHLCASSSAWDDADAGTVFSDPTISSRTATPPSDSSDDGGKGSEPPSQRIRIPSVHVLGLDDPWLLEGRELLRNYYDAESATLLEFQGGHHVPSAQKDIDELVRAILGAFEASHSLEPPM